MASALDPLGIGGCCLVSASHLTFNLLFSVLNLSSSTACSAFCCFNFLRAEYNAEIWMGSEIGNIPSLLWCLSASRLSGIFANPSCFAVRTGSKPDVSSTVVFNGSSHSRFPGRLTRDSRISGQFYRKNSGKIRKIGFLDSRDQNKILKF